MDNNKALLDILDKQRHTFYEIFGCADISDPEKKADVLLSLLQNYSKDRERVMDCVQRTTD